MPNNIGKAGSGVTSIDVERIAASDVAAHEEMIPDEVASADLEVPSTYICALKYHQNTL